MLEVLLCVPSCIPNALCTRVRERDGHRRREKKKEDIELSLCRPTVREAAMTASRLRDIRCRQKLYEYQQKKKKKKIAFCHHAQSLKLRFGSRSGTRIFGVKEGTPRFDDENVQLHRGLSAIDVLHGRGVRTGARRMSDANLTELGTRI